MPSNELNSTIGGRQVPISHFQLSCETLILGFTFDLHHLANPKSPKANFILEFPQAANLNLSFLPPKIAKTT